MTVFLDTNAIAALANKRDQSHLPVVQAFQSLVARNEPIVTTNFVLDETYTLVRRRVGHAAAVAIMRRVEQSAIKVFHVSPVHETRAKAIFIRYGDKHFSFTDCTSFAVIEQKRIPLVLTVDQDFRLYSFRHCVAVLP